MPGNLFLSLASCLDDPYLAGAFTLSALGTALLLETSNTFLLPTV